MKTSQLKRSPMKRGGIKRKPRRKYKKRTENQKAIDYLDKLWSKVVRLLEGRICPCCSEREVKHAHHIVSRRHKSTRWDLANGIGLCAYCHRFVAHQDPEIFRLFLITRIGEHGIKTLVIQSQQVKAYDMELSRIGLEAKLKEV